MRLPQGSRPFRLRSYRRCRGLQAWRRSQPCIELVRFATFAMAGRAAMMGSVADDINWRTRVLSELEAAKNWERDWGQVYQRSGDGDEEGEAPDVPSISERIEKLKGELHELEREAARRRAEAEAKLHGTDAAAAGSQATADANANASFYVTTNRERFSGKKTFEKFGVATHGKRKLGGGVMPANGPGVDW